MRLTHNTPLEEGLAVCRDKCPTDRPAYWQGTIALVPTPAKHYVSSVAYQKMSDRRRLGNRAHWYVDVRFANGRVEEKALSVIQLLEQEIAA